MKSVMVMTLSPLPETFFSVMDTSLSMRMTV
jgi:hypothetical protein